MRGSTGNRYRMVADGIELDGSLPHVEKAAKIWQGPSPNLKLIMRDFSSQGHFLMKVTAYKGQRKTNYQMKRKKILSCELSPVTVLMMVWSTKILTNRKRVTANKENPGHVCFPRATRRSTAPCR